MTKQEKMAQEVMAKQLIWNEFLATYPQRFAALMYEFMTLAKETHIEEGLGFKVEKLGPNTYLFEGEVNYPVEAKLMVVLPEEYQPDYVWQFETMEGVVAEYHERKAEEARKAAAKREAMEKLRSTFSAEELALLGFPGRS